MHRGSLESQKTMDPTERWTRLDATMDMTERWARFDATRAKFEGCLKKLYLPQGSGMEIPVDSGSQESQQTMDPTERVAKFDATRDEFEGYSKRLYRLQGSGMEVAEQYWEYRDECKGMKEDCAALDPADMSFDQDMMASMEKDAERMRYAVEDFEGLALKRVQGHRMVLLKLMEESEDRPELTADFVAELRAVLSDPWNRPLFGNKPVDKSEPGWARHLYRVGPLVDWPPEVGYDNVDSPIDWCGKEDLLWRQSWYRSREKRRKQAAKDCLAELIARLDVNAPPAPVRAAKERPQPY